MNESQIKKAIEDYMRSATTAQVNALADWIAEQEWAKKGPDLDKIRSAIRNMELAVNEIEAEIELS